jgi:probable F420-dependent oxidoreductase
MAEAGGPGISVMLSGLHRMFGPDLRAIVDAAKVTEDSGVEELVIGDHVAMGEQTHRYPYGPFAWPYEEFITRTDDPQITPDEPWPETLVMLTAIAMATSTIRIGTGVLLTPLRPAVLLAKSIATIDQLSGGRVELGVGIGWQPEEYECQGLDWDARWRLFDDGIRACRVLWRDVPATFHSETVNFDRLYCVPQPAQERVPIWYGSAARPATARRIAELGDGWFPLTITEAPDVAEGAAMIGEAMTAAGRDPAELRIRVPLIVRWNKDGTLDGPATAAPVPGLTEAGVTRLWVVVGPHIGLETHADIAGFLETLQTALAA